MAMAAAPLALDATKEIRAEAAKQYAAFNLNPIGYAADRLFKIGLASTLAGIGAYITSVATSRAERQFLNDMDQTLGINNENPPTPPAKPPPPVPPPFYANDLGAIIHTLSTLSPADAPGNLSALKTAYNASVDLNTQLGNLSAPSASISASNDLNGALAQCMTDMGWVPPPPTQADADAAAADLVASEGRLHYLESKTQGPEGLLEEGILKGKIANDKAILAEWKLVEAGAYPTVGSISWVTIKTDSLQAQRAVNALCSQLNLSQPFITDETQQAALGSVVNQAWGIVVSIPIVGAIASGSAQVAASVASGVSQVSAGANALGQDIQGAAAGVATMIGDAEKAAQYLARGLLGFPRILADSAGYAVAWGVNTISTDLYPWLLGVGLVLMASATVLRWFGPRLASRLKLGANARVAVLWNRFDKWYHTRGKIQAVWTQKATEAMIHSANAEPFYVPEATKEPAPAVPPAKVEHLPVPAPGTVAGTAPPEPPSPPEAIREGAPTATAPPAPSVAPPEAPPSPPGPAQGPSAPPVPEDTPSERAARLDEATARLNAQEPEAPEPHPMPESPSAPVSVNPESSSTAETAPGTLPEEAAPNLRSERMAAEARAKEEPPAPRAWTSDEILAAAQSFSVKPGADGENYPEVKEAVEASRGVALRPSEEERLKGMLHPKTRRGKPGSQRAWRGAMETKNQGYNPDAYGE